MNLKEKIQNGRDNNLHMNKKQNGYLNVNSTYFFVCGSELLNLLILYDLGAETNISDVYCSSFALYCIVKSKMDVILDIYY